MFAELFKKYGCDKERCHRYGIAYDALLLPYLDRRIKLLEIGIDRGASLRCWREALPRADVWAIDIDVGSLQHVPEGVHGIIGSQYNDTFLRSVTNSVGGWWDVVIDDGSHLIHHQRFTFDYLWPSIRPGGLYIIEDLESSKMRPAKYNPQELETTLDWAMRTARDGVRRRAGGVPTPLITFFRELVALRKAT